MWGAVLLGFLIFASTSVHPAIAQSGPPGSGWALTFDDEFDGNSLDLGKWGYVPAYYDYLVTAQSKSDPSAVVEGNGVLQLLTYLTDPNGPPTQSNTTTGQISTRGKFTQQFGWFEFRCKFGPGAGMDEAICLYAPYGSGPYQEIDMPEWLGNRPTTSYLAHWYVPPGGNWSGTVISPQGPDYSADFHTYAINWQPDSITYYIDGIQVWQTTDHVPQYPMDISIGSGSSNVWGGDINASSCPNSMVIDYVRVYQGGGTIPPSPAPPSPNGSIITPGQGGSLTTSEGTWTFGSKATDGVNSYTQLNGNADGWAVKLEIANGNLYAFNQVDGHWWLRQNGSWGDAGTTDPLGSPSPVPNGSTLYPGQGGSLATSEGTWTFGGLSWDGIDSYTLLNGSSNGWAVELAISNGNLYAFNQVDGHWWLRQNDTWVDFGTAPPPFPASSPPLPSGSGLTLTNQASGMDLNVLEASKASWAEVIQWPHTPGATNAQWQLTPTGDGYYYITNVNSGMDLNVPEASTAAWTTLIQYPHTPGATNAEWKITSTGAGSFYVTNRNSGMDLNDPEASTSAGTQMIQYPHTPGATNAEWLIPGFTP
jgi:beta-glucanase (GH16 family)